MVETKSLNLTQLRRISMLLGYLKSKSFAKKDHILAFFDANDKGFTERTFFRLKKTLDEDFGIKIEFDYSQESYFFDEANSFNVNSFLSLLEMVTTAEIFSTSFKEKNNALSFVSFENTGAIESVANFKIILNAIQMKLPISFTHSSFYHLKDENYTVKPYFLKQYQNRWYVVGETDKGYRTFGIDRIQDINLGSKKFKPKTEEAIEKFSHVVGLNFVDHPIERIKLRFHISQKPYLQSLPLHHSQKEIASTKKETFDIELLIHPNFELNQQILKYGSLVTVLEPKWLALEIKKEIKNALGNY